MLGMKQRFLRFWREQAKPFLIIVIVLGAVKSAVADWNTVPTGSMRPTIVEGDRIFVNKLAYGLKVPFTTLHLVRWSTPQRGEIVVFFSPRDGTRLVKRVIGVPGDTVQMIDEQLLINGKRAGYAPLASAAFADFPPAQRTQSLFAAETLDGKKHAVMATPGLRAMRNFGPVTVPAGQYLVLGDNRDNSADSRFIGFIPRDSIVGRSSWVVMSLDYDDHYLPRRSRWFHGLE